MFGRITKFPLWKNDGNAIEKINSFQKESIDIYNKKVNDSIYNFVENPCLCGNKSVDDTVVSEKDRYGIKCEIVLCESCGLIRLKERLDEKSTEEFYKNEYRNIYVGQETASDIFFESQKKRGEVFLKLVKEKLNVEEIKTVFEIGCGAGGILIPFHDNGMKASGCDFGEKYLSFGQLKGLDLYQGKVNLEKTPKNSQDLIILSHVMEHFNEPVKTMLEIIEIIKPGKYLVVEVPGIFDIKKTYFNPMAYFQNAHVHNYYCSYLNVFFKKIGLEVIYGDERCTFILKKPMDWVVCESDVFIYDPVLAIYPKKIKNELIKQCLFNFFKLTPYLYKKMFVRALEFFKVKDFVKNILIK